MDASGKIGGDVDIDLKAPDASGSLKPKGKGGFKFPSFNRKDKKPKIGEFARGDAALYCYICINRNYCILVIPSLRLYPIMCRF